MGQLVIKPQNIRTLAQQVQSDHMKMNKCPCYFTNGTTEMEKEEGRLLGAQESEDNSPPLVFVRGS